LALKIKHMINVTLSIKFIFVLKKIKPNFKVQKYISGIFDFKFILGNLEVVDNEPQSVKKIPLIYYCNFYFYRFLSYSRRDAMCIPGGVAKRNRRIA
jgi:hypothetical protein